MTRLKHNAFCLLWATTCILLFFQSSELWAQTLLTKEEAVRVTLENNYGIRIAENNIEIAKNNTSKRNTGHLPTLTANSSGNFSATGSSTQRLEDGSRTTVSTSGTWGGNASMAANYTLYDQTRRATTDQLRELLNLSNLAMRRTVELTLLDMYTAYYQVARLSTNLMIQVQTIEVSKRRLQRVQYQYEYGQGTRLDLLNAQVDVQRDSINYLNIQNDLANSRRNLGVIMGRSIEGSFEVDTTVVYADMMTLPELMQAAKVQNVDLLIAEKDQDLNQTNLNIIQADRLPTIGTSASYAYSLQNTTAGLFNAFSSNEGLALGLNLTWRLFDGGRRSVQRQNTHIAIENQRIFQEQLEQELDRDVTNSWESYLNALYVLEAEAANLETNELNFERSEEQFNIGQITSIEFRLAQVNLLTAARNYNTAKYDAKIIELELFQLTGRLLDLQL